MYGYMFDTNIFNDILDGKIDVVLFPEDLQLYVTHVQLDEIQATRDEQRRTQLMSVFSAIPQESIPTASTVIGVSRLGQSRLSDGILYNRLRTRLDELSKKGNNPKDIALAETAIVEGLTLVTHDRHLFRVVTEFDGAACNLYEVLKTTKR
jgi:predicted nucleic acid-binding protein